MFSCNFFFGYAIVWFYSVHNIEQHAHWSCSFFSLFFCFARLNNYIHQVVHNHLSVCTFWKSKIILTVVRTKSQRSHTRFAFDMLGINMFLNAYAYLCFVKVASDQLIYYSSSFRKKKNLTYLTCHDAGCWLIFQVSILWW